MKKIYTCCPACGSECIEEIVRSHKFPAILFPIEKDRRNSVSVSDIVAKSCAECQHIFLDEIELNFNQKIYTDYYYLYPYGDLESMEQSYRKPFDSLFSFFAKNGSNKKLLEIGCSNKNQLNIFTSYGYSCIGISPGAKSDANIVDGFYEKFDFDQEFDCVVSRFNLEHVIDLNVFLSKVLVEMKEGGLLFVQVPNVENFLSTGILNIFAHEHPHYFCERSLSCLLRRIGFDLEVIRAGDSPSIIAIARKPIVKPQMRDKIKVIPSVFDEIINIIHHGGDHRFVFYGAGLSLTGLIYIDQRILNYKNNISIIDDNKLLADRYMPNTDLQIELFSAFQSAPSDTLFVLLNKTYHLSILPKIKAAGFRRVYYLDDNGLSFKLYEDEPI